MWGIGCHLFLLGFYHNLLRDNEISSTLSFYINHRSSGVGLGNETTYCFISYSELMNISIQDLYSSSFISYQSQLESPKWQEKRNEILRRDNNRCVMCGREKSKSMKFNDQFYNFGIDHSYPDITPEDIISSKLSIAELKSLIHTKEIGFRTINHELSVIAGTSTNGVLGVMNSNAISVSKTENASEKVEVNLVRHNSGMLFFLVNLKGADLTTIKAPIVYLTETPLFLNVHHKHYIIQHKAWEYDDEDLVTLCNECHAKVHKSIGAPVYSDKNGYMKEVHLTPCLRCGGTGYFPEYKHVDNGLCFRCKGARFENLIQYKDNTPKEDLPF